MSLIGNNATLYNVSVINVTCIAFLLIEKEEKKSMLGHLVDSIPNNKLY